MVARRGVAVDLGDLVEVGRSLLVVLRGEMEENGCGWGGEHRQARAYCFGALGCFIVRERRKREPLVDRAKLDGSPSLRQLSVSRQAPPSLRRTELGRLTKGILCLVMARGLALASEGVGACW